jgi:hypothetical protein
MSDSIIGLIKHLLSLESSLILGGEDNFLRMDTTNEL